MKYPISSTVFPFRCGLNGCPELFVNEPHDPDPRRFCVFRTTEPEVMDDRNIDCRTSNGHVLEHLVKRKNDLDG